MNRIAVKGPFYAPLATLFRRHYLPFAASGLITQPNVQGAFPSPNYNK
jgi:hypothetical protein